MDMLHVRRRGERAFIHWQISLVRVSLKMVMASTRLRTDCKFMAALWNCLVAVFSLFSISYQLPPKASCCSWITLNPLAFMMPIPLISLAYALNKESVCYSFWVTQLLQKCCNPYLPDLCLVPAPLLHLYVYSRFLGSNFQDPGMQKRV